MIENSWEEYPHFCLELALAGERRLRQYPVGPIVNEFVPLAKIKGLEVDNNGIDAPVEEHSQELTSEELMELHCVSQEEVMEESLWEEVTAKQ
ncbi:hypothetical protein AVEN_78216-1, partial [Araneus ventricosus]